MPSPFDRYKANVTSTVTKTMGEVALWIPADGSKPEGYAGGVLFSNPTVKDKLNDVEFNPFDWQMEYKNGLFPGLKESVDDSNEETVTIGEDEYFVKSVITKYDGGLSLAKLSLK